ncbi:MAG: hypothetical protein HKN76_01690 [Saprospiraceae bacterium]|nr:hypothetical protein [Saprospiraceae bacterium]
MNFYKDQLFHIYNQGNNRQQIFFSDENYRYFLWKMQAYLLPFGDLVSWCLMTTHFHWQFYVREVWIPRHVLRANVDEIEFLRRKDKYGLNARKVNRDWSRTAHDNDLVSLNQSIGDLQRSYTRALNKERNTSGSLFRNECKAQDGWIDDFVTLKKKGIEDRRFVLGSDYAYRCLCYIHGNPKKAKLVSKSVDYKWSSAKDYYADASNSICNLELGRKIIQFV